MSRHARKRRYKQRHTQRTYSADRLILTIDGRVFDVNGFELISIDESEYWCRCGYGCPSNAGCNG